VRDLIFTVIISVPAQTII